MSTIFSTQDLFTLIVGTTDVNGNNTIPIDVTIVKYALELKSPTGSTFELESSYDSVNKTIVYESLNNEFLTPYGQWGLKGILYTADDRRLVGTSTTFDVVKEWTSNSFVLLK